MMVILREALSSLDLTDLTTGETIPDLTPGDVLRAEFMEPLGLSAYALARATGMPANRISAIVHGSRAVTAGTALRLAAHFGTSAEFWMNLQTRHDLAAARRRAAA